MISAHLQPQDITSCSHCAGVILVHSSSSLFHSSVTVVGFLAMTLDQIPSLNTTGALLSNGEPSLLILVADERLHHCRVHFQSDFSWTYRDRSIPCSALNWRAIPAAVLNRFPIKSLCIILSSQAFVLRGQPAFLGDLNEVATIFWESQIWNDQLLLLWLKRVIPLVFI